MIDYENYEPSLAGNIRDLEQDLIGLSNFVAGKGATWAAKKSMYEQLDELKKTVLAQETPLSGGTVQDRANAALRSTAYTSHIKALAIAHEQFLCAQVSYSSAQAKFEAVRTLITNRREEIKRGI